MTRQPVFVLSLEIRCQTNQSDFLTCLLLEKSIENLPIVNGSNQLVGLVILKDLQPKDNYLTDQKCRLMVGAAVGVTDDYLERLIESWCDLICVDVAHGHDMLAGNAIQDIKQKFNIEVMTGNVVTP